MAEALASLGDSHLLLKEPERALASYRESQMLFEREACVSLFFIGCQQQGFEQRVHFGWQLIHQSFQPA